jgi:hypothetical protein
MQGLCLNMTCSNAPDFAGVLELANTERAGSFRWAVTRGDA